MKKIQTDSYISIQTNQYIETNKQNHKQSNKWTNKQRTKTKEEERGEVGGEIQQTKHDKKTEENQIYKQNKNTYT